MATNGESRWKFKRPRTFLFFANAILAGSPATQRREMFHQIEIEVV